MKVEYTAKFIAESTDEWINMLAYMAREIPKMPPGKLSSYTEQVGKKTVTVGIVEDNVPGLE